ncbi:MAG TPA: hypothetical protein VJ728_04915 [Candidatus Binataceae bacterium]|nr:hypothetical protein [Candidatus Binataceae bacterium]
MSSNQPASLGAAALRPMREPRQLNFAPLNTLSVILFIIGVIGFIIALLTGRHQRLWAIWLVNFLFFTGIAQGGVVCSAAFYLTQGRWAGATHYRIAEAFTRFLPIGFILFWGVFLGRRWIFPWIIHPPRQQVWLNVPFLFARDGIALLVMTVVSMWFVSLSRRPAARAWARRFTDIDMPPVGVRWLAPTVAILYCGIYSLLAFDLIMSLSPKWHSTLFGWWYFATDFWSATVAMGLMVAILRRLLGPETSATSPGVLHDIGKMIFAFSIFWMYTGFAQYLVIWYGDIPAETFFIVVRFWHAPWIFLSWSAPILIWLVPFVVLLGVRPKRTPGILGTVSLLGLIGVWILNYILVLPSLLPNALPFGWVELTVTAGFLGIFLLCSVPGLRLVAEEAAEPPPATLQATPEIRIRRTSGD